MNMERKFTEEEAEIIKRHSGTIIKLKRHIDVLYEQIEVLEKEINEKENSLRRIIFGDSANILGSFWVSKNNCILFSMKNDKNFYQLDINSLIFEKI